MRGAKAALGALVVAMAAGAASAQEVDRPWLSWGPVASEDAGWSLGVSRTQWVDVRLPLFPKAVVTGGLDTRAAYATTFTLGRSLGTLDVAPGRWWGVEGLRVEAEATISVHDGLQDHVEGTAGVMVRSPRWDVGNLGTWSLGWANGLSYAFQDPVLERGPSGVRGVDTERLQYYMAFEVGFHPDAIPDMEVFARLHHRSGIYGVISPDSTGSNMLGGGLRWRF